MVNVLPSQSELVQHDGVRNLFFCNLYRPRSQPTTRDLDLSTIARAFPNLEILEIICNGIRWHWSFLQTLANHLPHLRHLTIAMDVSISSRFKTPKETVLIQSLTGLEFDLLGIQPVDIDPFINYLEPYTDQPNSGAKETVYA
ncbi:hypothetical protein FRB94_011181 [Tulasnella sp. JGI-2019a]|nr:hypothetical protein FRB93_002748 [Tulasnella sp. JGI-2019a]KAG8992926.1 hypothetical protein FRB94_011181 [Tulasnella sp. JGI-2019a]